MEFFKELGRCLLIAIPATIYWALFVDSCLHSTEDHYWKNLLKRLGIKK